MHNTLHNSHEASQQSIQAGYEVTDLNVRAVIGLLAVIVFVAIAGFFATIWVIRFFDEARGANIMVSPLADPSGQRPNVTYMVQSDPVGDRKRLFTEQEERLSTYSVGEETNLGHMPIERAIEILASGEAEYRQKPTTALLSGNGSAPETSQDTANTSAPSEATRQEAPQQ